jgi:hypothetical protein
MSEESPKTIHPNSPELRRILGGPAPYRTDHRERDRRMEMKRITCPRCGWMYVEGQEHSFCMPKGEGVKAKPACPICFMHCGGDCMRPQRWGTPRADALE